MGEVAMQGPVSRCERPVSPCPTSKMVSPLGRGAELVVYPHHPPWHRPQQEKRWKRGSEVQCGGQDQHFQTRACGLSGYDPGYSGPTGCDFLPVRGGVV